jgi:5'-nucleotidase (lipoprotein e(P4) family)
MQNVKVWSVVAALLLAACTDVEFDESGAADIQGEDKADTGPGIEVTARLAPGTVDLQLTTAVPRRGYVFYAGEGSKVTLEVTHAGSDARLDSLLKVYGPRLADASYPKTLAADDDSGYGKLSRIKDLDISIPGFYLVEVTTGPAAPAIAAPAKARLKLACTGTCTTTLPIQPIDEGLKWYRRAAERRAATFQAYALAAARLQAKVAAGVPASWAVVLDIDETTLDNSAYQQARLDLGVGFSPGSWTAWVEQKAARGIDGAAPFIQKVRQLGGKVVFVTNRKAGSECPQTEDNLRALGIAWDGMLCQTDSSDKNPRFQALAAGSAPGLPKLDAIMYVGDNIQDFPGLSQELRRQDAAAFARFGDSFFLLPNPMYGSFDKNVD